MDDTQVKMIQDAIYRVANTIESGPYMHELLEVLEGISARIDIANKIYLASLIHESDNPRLLIKHMQQLGVPDELLPTDLLP